MAPLRQEPTVYDAMDSMRELLRPSAIAEVTGLRPETVSRISPGYNVARKTERVLDDLYAVCGRLKPLVNEGRDHLRFALVRRRDEFGGQSIAEMIRRGDTDRVLDALPSAPAETDADLQIDDSIDAELLEMERTSIDDDTVMTEPSTGASPAFLAKHPQTAQALESVRDRVAELFGTSELRLDVLTDDTGGEDLLFAGVVTDLPRADAEERLGRFFAEEWDRLGAGAANLIVGID